MKDGNKYMLYVLEIRRLQYLVQFLIDENKKLKGMISTREVPDEGVGIETAVTNTEMANTEEDNELQFSIEL